MLVLDYVVHRTSVGMAMRAISWDKTYVPLMGIPVNLIISITFATALVLRRGRHDVRLAYPVIDPTWAISSAGKHSCAAVVGGIGNVRGADARRVHPRRRRDHGGGAAALHVSRPRGLQLLLALIILRPHGILGNHGCRRFERSVLHRAGSGRSTSRGSCRCCSRAALDLRLPSAVSPAQQLRAVAADVHRHQHHLSRRVLNLVNGYMGEFSLAHAGFMAVGAYTSCDA
jgi:hypothetical protein